MKNNGSRSKIIHGVHLTRHHGVGFGQPCPNGIGLLFDGMKGRLRHLETDLKLAIFPSCFGIAVLGRPPLSEKAPGVVAVVRIGGVRRRGRHGRCSVRGPAGPRKKTETVIHNKPIGESEQFIIINKKCQSHLKRRRCWFIGMFSSGISSVVRLPRLSSLAMKDDWIYRKGERKLLQGFSRWRRAKEQLRVEMCSRLKPSAGI